MEAILIILVCIFISISIFQMIIILALDENKKVLEAKIERIEARKAKWDIGDLIKNEVD